MAKNTVQSVEPNIADLVNGWLKSYKVDYKLEPDSKLYVFPIPPQVLSLNSNIIPNDRKQ